MNLGSVMSLVIIAVIMAVSLKNKNPEISSIISVAACVCIIFMCISRIGAIVEVLKKLFGYIKIDSGYLRILLKLIGIAYICEFAAGISRDAGHSAVSSQIELLGKLTMLMVSLPVLMQVIDTITEMMN